MRNYNIFMLLFIMLPLATNAQDIKLSGVGYLDYFYNIADDGSPDDEGLNGFSYRRLYLTTDFKLSNKYSGRARLEADDSKTLSNGTPAPFVKDLYLKAKGVFGKNQDVTIGIQSPPSFNVSEKVWGYRSLEKTIQDKFKWVGSRDFGVQLSGNVKNDGSVKYAVMVANNSGNKAETNKYKRGYAQLQLFPNKKVSATLGADYARYDMLSVTNINGFLGFTLEKVAAGVEAIYHMPQMENATLANEYGVSTFVRGKFNPKTEAIIRYDYVGNDVTDDIETYFTAGIALMPNDHVSFIPNFYVYTIDANQIKNNQVTGRVTLEVSF